jgi:hypothetical protein
LSGKQRGADPLLQRADRLAHRRGGHAKTPEGRTKTAQFSDGEENHQPIQMHSLD